MGLTLMGPHPAHFLWHTSTILTAHSCALAHPLGIAALHKCGYTAFGLGGSMYGMDNTFESAAALSCLDMLFLARTCVEAEVCNLNILWSSGHFYLT